MPYSATDCWAWRSIPVQRDYHAHEGGSLQFGPDGNLYIATGDNTSPFFPDTRAPVDERPGKRAFDARRTSANTNDLRGKILRITPERDGTYNIPDGNLFPKETPNTRPEIYVMGARNPFRMAVDQETGYLYWGNVGGVDEVHQVREAGFYGCWPYFYGNHQVYDHVKKYLDDIPDPDNPVNRSPNNTGLRELPWCRPAFMWYSDERFELLGGRDDGKNIMAGPVYYSGRYPDAPGKLPEYYDGRLFIYDWVRDWIRVVEMDEDHRYHGMETFMDSTEFSSPMDMEFGPDGALYLLEYGSQGYAQNPDARLSRIEYASGNRRPVARISAGETRGAAPFEVRLSAENSHDPDEGDRLSYAWRVEGGARESTGLETRFRFTEPGRYRVELTVTDSEGETASDQVELLVGNEPPEVEIALEGNRDFYWDNANYHYEVTVYDREDGAIGGGIDPSEVKVLFNYRPATGRAGGGEQQVPRGKSLMSQSDCSACHAVDQQSIGPSFRQIANRYAGRDQVVDTLAAAIITGSSGKWEQSTQPMPPHPQLEKQEAEQMAEYILSLSKEKAGISGLPVSGTLQFDEHREQTGGSYRLTASYTDRGASGIRGLETSEEILFRPPRLQAENYDRGHSVKTRNKFVDGIRHDSYILFEDVDLTEVRYVSYSVASNTVGGAVEM
ncbi:MAG: PQQ-dependent sugar dehydrogenase, partial [Balneolaceae bacterium]|nr:PQQ-dependent sugar dehydrogenase [Balneolaceae bacterium]